MPACLPAYLWSFEDECCTAGSWGPSTFLRLGVTSARDQFREHVACFDRRVQGTSTNGDTPPTTQIEGRPYTLGGMGRYSG